MKAVPGPGGAAELGHCEDGAHPAPAQAAGLGRVDFASSRW